MAQIFHRSTNTISRASIFGAVYLIGLALWIFYDLEASPYTTQQNVAREQPIQFSHAHHAGAIGIDCRYCHTSVEKARSEEHTSELQSRRDLVCRLLLEKKK